MKQIIFDSSLTIFTTGALLNPMKVTDSNGKEIWVWHVSEFIDDSFLDGEIYNPQETAISRDKLIQEVA